MADWCCDQEYEVCSQTKNQINVCNTNFASANANVSIAEANAVESSMNSSSTSTSRTVAMFLSSFSSISSTVALQSQSSIATTTSSIAPLQSRIYHLRLSGEMHLLIKRASHYFFTHTGFESVKYPQRFQIILGIVLRSHCRRRDRSHRCRLPCRLPRIEIHAW